MLNTAGHWGWSKEKKANVNETDTYKMVAMGTILIMPTSIPPQTNEFPFLRTIRQEAEKLRAMAPKTIWLNYSNYVLNVSAQQEEPMKNFEQSIICYYNDSIYASLKKAGYPLPSNGNQPEGTYQIINLKEIERARNLVLEKKGTRTKIDTKEIAEALLFPDKFHQAAPQQSSLTPKSSANSQTDMPTTWKFTAANGMTLENNGRLITLNGSFSSGKRLSFSNANINGTVINIDVGRTDPVEVAYRAFQKCAGTISDVQPPSLRYLLDR